MSDAVVRRLSGPVLHAQTSLPFQINEAVLVGERELLGEVIQLQGRDVVIQVYEDTTGLEPGTPVRRTSGPLAIPLGPGVLGHLFDGLLRPLPVTADFVEPGVRRRRSESFHFRPRVAEGAHVKPGDTFGTVPLSGGRTHRCLVPPDVEGEVGWIAPEGDYPEDQTVCRLRSGLELSMIVLWPVRRPRPVASRKTPDHLLVTGQRILDTLFPVARGSRTSLPGGFGTGKTVLLETLAKWSDADIVVYVGCGERGNEMAGVLHGLPALTDPHTDRPLMERTVIVANTSNMPVAAREASIYTGITVAEYFRDQGLHVALMADSTSRWAEALREVSGRLGELPAEGGYPAYLSSRLAEFYERAGQVITLSGEEASVTVIGAISPPSGDFSEPVTKNTQRYVRCVWSLDPGRARARLYPAVHPLESYSSDVVTLAPWWESHHNPRWTEQRRDLLKLLQEQALLERMSRIVGKDALPPHQRLVLMCAEVATQAFLQQSALSEVDAHCSPARQAEMLRVLMRFVELSRRAVERGVEVERIEALPLLRRLRRMGEEIGNDQLERFAPLEREIGESLEALEREVRRAS